VALPCRADPRPRRDFWFKGFKESILVNDIYSRDQWLSFAFLKVFSVVQWQRGSQTGAPTARRAIG
jgi:hypothetical protein